MAGALRRLQSSTPSHLPDSVRAFGIRNGKGGFARLFSTHPALEERIARLQSLARA